AAGPDPTPPSRWRSHRPTDRGLGPANPDHERTAEGTLLATPSLPDRPRRRGRPAGYAEEPARGALVAVRPGHHRRVQIPEVQSLPAANRGLGGQPRLPDRSRILLERLPPA